MTSGNPNSPAIHPDYCHALSPTINKWCPLRACDIHSLRGVGMFDDGKEIYYYGNHPIKWVRVTGVIVAVDEFSTRRIYTIDDSSGACIECTCPIPPSQLPNSTGPAGGDEPSKPQKDKPAPQPSTASPIVPWDDMDVGVVVKIKGKPGQFRDVKQVEIVKAEVMRSTDQEVKCWDEVLKFRQEVLSVAWVVGEEEGERLRRKAMRERQYPRKGKESDESRKKRKDAEKRERHEQDKRRRKEKEAEGLGQGNKVNYPSLALRKQIAESVKGKYDALGI